MNVKIRKMYFTIKLYLEYVKYEIDSPLPSNKTAKRNSQHFTNLYNKVYNIIHNKCNK